jgi:hypothetical protein
LPGTAITPTWAGRSAPSLCNPAYHRLHHALDGPYDVNLGIVLTVWDVLARRAVFPTRGAPACRTGLAGRPIPVEQAGARYRPLRVFTAQMAEPFVAPDRGSSSN